VESSITCIELHNTVELLVFFGVLEWSTVTSSYIVPFKYFHNYLSGTTFGDESTSPTSDITSPCSALNCPNAPAAREGAFQSTFKGFKSVWLHPSDSSVTELPRLATLSPPKPSFHLPTVYITPPMMPDATSPSCSVPSLDCIVANAPWYRGLVMRKSDSVRFSRKYRER